MDRARRNVIYRAPRESPAELTGGVKEDPLTVSTGWSIGSAADDDRNPAIEKRQLWAAPRVAVSGDSEMFGSKEGDKLEMPPFPVPSVGELGEVRIPAPRLYLRHSKRFCGFHLCVPIENTCVDLLV